MTKNKILSIAVSVLLVLALSIALAATLGSNAAAPVNSGISNAANPFDSTIDIETDSESNAITVFLKNGDGEIILKADASTVDLEGDLSVDFTVYSDVDANGEFELVGTITVTGDWNDPDSIAIEYDLDDEAVANLREVIEEDIKEYLYSLGFDVAEENANVLVEGILTKILIDKFGCTAEELEGKNFTELHDLVKAEIEAKREERSEKIADFVNSIKDAVITIDVTKLNEGIDNAFAKIAEAVNGIADDVNGIADEFESASADFFDSNYDALRTLISSTKDAFANLKEDISSKELKNKEAILGAIDSVVNIINNADEFFAGLVDEEEGLQVKIALLVADIRVFAEDIVEFSNKINEKADEIQTNVTDWATNFSEKLNERKDELEVRFEEKHAELVEWIKGLFPETTND